MIDFGLGGLFDRFETKFGPRAATALLALIWLTIAVACLSLIANSMLSAHAWLSNTAEGSTLEWKITRVLKFISVFGQLIVGLLLVSHLYEGYTHYVRLIEMGANADSLIDKAKQISEQVEIARALDCIRPDTLISQDEAIQAYLAGASGCAQPRTSADV